MTKRDLGEYFVQVFVIGFGFLSGLFMKIGVNPETIIIDTFSTITETLMPNSGFSGFFILIGILSTLGSIAAAYAMGGKMGLVAVGIAFISGLIFGSTFSIILLIISILIGLLVSSFQ